MKQSLEITQRISKPHGRFMIFTGILFDLLPLLAVFAMAILMMYVVTGNKNIEVMAGDVESCASLSQTWYRFFIPFGNTDTAVDASRCARFGIETGTAGLTGILAVFILGPVLYTFISWVSTFFAYVLFTVWFLFKGVNIWSVTETKKLFMTISTLAIESIPLLDLLPGTTLMVWRQVVAAQVEDKVKNEAVKKQIEQPLSRRTRARRPIYAPA